MSAARILVGILILAALSGCFSPISLIYSRKAAPSSVNCAGQHAVWPPLMKQLQETMTLEQCVEIARTNNPGLAAGAWDVQTAVAQRDSAASERWPTVRAAGSYNTYLQNQRLVPVRKNNDPGMFGTSLLAGDIILRLPLFTGGRITSDISAADLLSQAASHRLARTWEELVFNVSSTFYTILGQRPVIESLEFSIKALKRQRQKAVDMMRVGKAAKVEVLRTEVRISDVEQRLVRERTILEIQRRVLASLMGLGEGIGTVTVQGDLRQNRDVPDLNGALAMAYAERGDYRAARAALDAQVMRMGAARAALWPSLSLQGAYGARYAEGVTDNAAAFINRLMRTATGPEFNSPGVSRSLPVGNIGIVADFPVLDGGKIKSQIREQEAKLASAQQDLRKLELRIRLDVETALLNVDSARQRVQATRKAIEQAQESFRIESEKYDLGKGSITDVLDAQSAMLEVRTNHYRALADHSVALAGLGFATGEKR